MELQDFEAILHICIVFNFLYTFENFSRRIAIFFSAPFRQIRSAGRVAKLAMYVQRIKDDEILKDPKLNTSNISKKLERNYIELNNSIKDIAPPLYWDPEYRSKFKICYFFSGLYALFLLLIASLHNYLIQPFLYPSLFMTDIFFSVVLLFVFIITFFDKIRVGLLLSILIFLILIIFFFGEYTFIDFSKYEMPNKNCSIIFAITIVFLSPLLHFLRLSLQALGIVIRTEFIFIKYRSIFGGIEREIKTIDLAQSILNKYKK